MFASNTKDAVVKSPKAENNNLVRSLSKNEGGVNIPPSIKNEGIILDQGETNGIFTETYYHGPLLNG